jgi:Ca2+-transporting ATPase
MHLAALYDLSADKVILTEALSALEIPIVEMAMWASEPIPFDPMEKALHEVYGKLAPRDRRRDFTMIHEYPLSGVPPLMTHVFESQHGERIIACKGAPEALIKQSKMTGGQRDNITRAYQDLSQKGYRVLAVGYANHDSESLPTDQHDFRVTVLGIVAFYDPPKKNIESVFNAFYNAGIDVKIITGDNAFTTATIARQIHFRNADSIMVGDELMNLTDEEVCEKARRISIFARMFPEAKLKILNALKKNGEIVAMTGDGVNDAPALKAAHIGIAMGVKGTEIAREASSLILSDDDLSRMVSAVAMGRRIYTNLKKAIQYIISIHIPIILIVFLPLLLGWIYPNIFTPVHIIFLELIMGPTCSIIYENEPLEENAMQEKPRSSTKTFFNGRELATSIVQGLVITIGLVAVYHYGTRSGSNESTVRTMVFTSLVAANICLTLVNRSFFYSILHTIRNRNPLMLMIIVVTVLLTIALLTVPFLKDLFGFADLSLSALIISITTGVASALWFEGVKFINRKHSRQKQRTSV